MFNFNVTRNAARAIRPASTVRRAVAPHAVSASRPLSSTVIRAKDEKKDGDYYIDITTRTSEASAAPEGAYARTDENVKIEYPDERGIPHTPTVRGRGGIHFKRTLPEFSLENKVSVVTGGARGLGLVMAQALVTSGSDVAIVDLNSK